MTSSSRWMLSAGALTLIATAAAQPAVTRLLVLNKAENSLAIVDPVSRSVVARVAVGESPHEITVSADGQLAFVANYGSRNPGQTISVVDVNNHRELRRIDLGPLRRPHGITFAGGKVYFTAEANKLIGRYDPRANMIDWLLGTGQNTTHMVLVSTDGNTLFTANIGSDSITIIERAGGQLAWNETVVPVGKGPEGMDLSPDGKELWVAHSGDGGISIIDVAAKKRVATIDVHTRRSNRLKFTPDGKRVIVSDMAGDEVVVIDAATRKGTKIIKPGRSPEGILIVPDGSLAYIAVAGDDNVAIIDLKTLELQGRIHTGSGPDGMAWVAQR